MKGGYLGIRERWVYGDCMMKAVNSYKYLGICFSTRLSFYHACQDLVSRANRALLCIMSKLYRIDCKSINVFLKIFDVQVQPIVLYGAEIWGLESWSSVTDNVHLFGFETLFRCVTGEPQMILCMEKLEGFLFKLMHVFAVYDTG